MYLVNERLENLTEWFIKTMTEKQEATVADVLKWHPYPSDFQMLPGEVKKNGSNGLIRSMQFVLTAVNMTLIWWRSILWRRLVTARRVSVLRICLLQRRRMTICFWSPQVKFLDVKNYIWPGLTYDTWLSQWVAVCKS